MVRVPLEKNCENCTLKFKYRNKNRRFCSGKCGDSFRHKNFYVKKKSVDGCYKKCSYDKCDKLVWHYPRHIKANKLRFCNTTCMSGHMSNSPLLVCEFCNKEFYCTRSQRYLRNRKHCSIECRGKAMSRQAEIRNKLNPPSKGVLNRRIRYSKKMDDWRKAIFERDNYTCQICNKRGGYLQADHIKPFAYFEELRFELSNGRTLCKPCHENTDTFGRRVIKLYGKN